MISSSTGSTQTASKGKEKTVDGCITQQGSDFYLATKKGGMWKLSSADSLSAHLGHHVKVHGTQDTTSARAGKRVILASGGSAPVRSR